MKVEGMQGSFFVEYLCSCGLPVVVLGKRRNFACVHCDAVCYAGNCYECKQLYNSQEEDEEEE